MANSVWSDGTDAVLAPLRAGNRYVPTTLSFSVSRSVVIDGVTDPGEVIHVLPEVREPTRHYHSGIIITVDGRATTLVLAATDGASGQLRVFADDGGVSDIGLTKGWATEGWDEHAIGLAQSTLERRNSLRPSIPELEPEPEPERITRAEHAPLQEFMTTSGHHGGIQSWQIDSDEPFPDVEGARLEMWSAITADGPTTYVRVAAAYRDDGTIAGLASIEGVPSAHDGASFCVVGPDGVHHNLGVSSLDQDLRADAVHMLRPLLVPEPTSSDSVAAEGVDEAEAPAPEAELAPRQLVLRHASRSDRGLVQPKNEDSVFAGARVLAIADGMSQPLGGDVASQVVIAALAALDDQPGDDTLGLLHAAVQNANAAIAAEKAHRPEIVGMATTLAAILFAGNHFGVTSIGDTRCYLLREGLLTQLTRDDTVVQILVDYNQIAPEQADDHPQQGQLTRALNGQPIEAPLTAYEAHAGDRYLLCTRGLWGPVRVNAIKEALSIPDLDTLAEQLIELALRGGGPDNVTVIVADAVEV
jgi:protein phosphatase